ncbi:MAG: hypothetical protein CSA74_01910 [Rhodobacterales bacterium]|nr:MAG: hypothetical protein CSA74_01910 [Rhodobacterales bacterium]
MCMFIARRPVFAFVSAIVLASVWLVSLVSPVSAQTGSFDPTICPGDHQGKLLVRLESGLAFRIQPHGFLLGRIAPEPAGPGLPPWGCPGNPVVTSHFSLAYRYEALLENKRNPQTPEGLGRPSLLRIIAGDGPVHMQESNLVLFHYSKDQFNSCEITNEGLEICRSCKVVDGRCLRAGSTEPGPNRPTAMYGRALPGVYEEHNGLPFIIHCYTDDRPDVPYPTNKWCEVRYKLMDGLSVSYRITDRKVSEDSYIAFDQEVRRQILAARAPEFDLLQ